MAHQSNEPSRASPPSAIAARLAMGYIALQAVCVATKLGIAVLLSKGALTSSEIARAVDGNAARRGASPTARVGGLRYCQGPRLGIRWTPCFRLTTDRSNPLVALKWSTTQIVDRLETAIMQTLVLLVLSMVAGRANECLLIRQVGT